VIKNWDGPYPSTCFALLTYFEQARPYRLKRTYFIKEMDPRVKPEDEEKWESNPIINS